jgi:hypothetical protein
MFCVVFSGPKFKFVLFWKGTLIKLPTGFWASFARSSADISAREGEIVRVIVATASMSTQNREAVDILRLPIRG